MAKKYNFSKYNFIDAGGNVFIDEGATGLNAGMVVLLVVVGALLLFIVANYSLYLYTKRTLPAKKKKTISRKKMKRERLKGGVTMPGE